MTCIATCFERAPEKRPRIDVLTGSLERESPLDLPSRPAVASAGSGSQFTMQTLQASPSGDDPPPYSVHFAGGVRTQDQLRETNLLGTAVLFYARALYDYEATIEEEFDFKAGDIIAVTATSEEGWWSGVLLDEMRRVPGKAIFPRNFVRQVPADQVPGVTLNLSSQYEYAGDESAALFYGTNFSLPLPYVDKPDFRCESGLRLQRLF